MKNQEIIIIKEYDKLFCKEVNGLAEDGCLSQKEFESLAEHLENYPSYIDKEGKESNQSPLKVGRDYVQATTHVGVIITNERRRIQINPKIDLAEEEDGQVGRVEEVLTKMLTRYLKLSYRQFEKGIYKEENLPLLEAFIAVFLQEVQVIIKRGLARTYIPCEDNLTCLKGKLDFTNHIRHNLFHKERFYVRFDEFSIDRPINRVIKRALREVCRVAQNSTNYRLAIQQLHYFEEVRNTRDWRHDVKVSRSDRTVSNKAYQEAFQLAQLILRNLSPNNWQGEQETVSLLFPMEEVFESYVAERLRDIAPSNISITTQEKEKKVMTEHLPEGGTKDLFTVNPDIVARDNTKKHCIILDTKWKRLNGSIEMRDKKYDIKQGDIYQLYTYGKVYQRQEGKNTRLVLLYPRNEKFHRPIVLSECEGKRQGKEGQENKEVNPELLGLKIVPVDIAGLTSDKNSKTCKDAERQLRRQVFPEEVLGEDQSPDNRLNHITLSQPLNPRHLRTSNNR